MPVAADILITPRAKRDLAKIAQDTIDIWGAEQQTIYISGLYRFFEHIAHMPRLGRKAPRSMGARILFQRYESHYVYYRFTSQRVEILRLLHTKRDQENAYG